MKLRNIPSVNSLLDTLPWEKIDLPREYVIQIIRQELDNIRKRARSGKINVSKDQIYQGIYSAVMSMNQPNLKKIINGTGIILHTGLGRAPYSRKILQSVLSSMEGYSNLELNLHDGKRGERVSHISSLLNSLVAAESSLIVNNNAAAVLLALNTLAEGKEVIISRGQMVEIGGMFRIPDVIRKSGAKLVEVGTTNRTHFEDYLNAITDNTGVILMVHTSNYRIRGFTKEVPLVALAELSQKKRIPLIVDLGSGALFNLEAADLPYEPLVSEVLKQGGNLVTFSGDKLLGGPQAGVLCGKKRIVSRLHQNPLYRALRCDKMTVFLMEQTLRSYRKIPPDLDNLTYVLFTTSQKTLIKRGHRLVQALSSNDVNKMGVKVVPSEVEAGSGSLPTAKIASAALQFYPDTIRSSRLSDYFRNWKIPVLGYISGKRFYIDLKAVLPAQYPDLLKAIKTVSKMI